MRDKEDEKSIFCIEKINYISCEKIYVNTFGENYLSFSTIFVIQEKLRTLKKRKLHHLHIQIYKYYNINL